MKKTCVIAKLLEHNEGVIINSVDKSETLRKLELDDVQPENLLKIRFEKIQHKVNAV